MKPKHKRRLNFVLGALLATAVTGRADLIHRYSFNETSGTTVKDSVGTADGIIKGSGAAFDGAGQLVLPGGTSSAADPSTIAGYVDLPNHIINVLTNVTLESWVTWQGAGAWQRIFDLGTSQGGEDISDGNGNYLFLSPAGNVNLRFALRDPATQSELTQLTGPAPLQTGTEVCVTVTYDHDNNVARLYSNAVLLVTGPAPVALKDVNDVNNWLGRSQWGDPMFQGSYNEFRIYNTALNQVEVAGSYVSGTETPSTDPGPVSAINLSLTTPLTKGGTTTATATADFAAITGVPLAGIPGVTYGSSDTNVATVSADGTVNAVGVGSSTITVSFKGSSTSKVVNVTSGLPATLIHRYNFTSDVSDSVGTATGTLMGNATITGGQAVLDGTVGTYVDFPNDMLTNLDSITMEAWVTDNGSSPWARVWDFGNSTGGEDLQGGGTRYLYLTVASGAYDVRGAYNGGSGEQLLIWPIKMPPVGQKTHVVWTSDASFHTANLYVDGLRVASSTNFTITPRAIGTTFNDWLGRSQYNDPPFNGSFDEFRIYDGAITEMQASLDAATGPDKIVTDPGALQSIQLTLGTNGVYLGALPTQARLVGTYANQDNVNVTTFSGATYQSSDTNVATINTAGLITAVSLGNATLTASYGGKTATLPITVTAPPGWTPPTLVHRYSFSDAASSTVAKDSVGSADGSLAGNGAAFDGNGHVTVPGGGASGDPAASIAGYVDLPNHIINVLTNLTIETWVTWNGAGAWSRIFDLGTSSGGEDVSSGNGNYMFLTPQNGINGSLRFSVRDPLTAIEYYPLDAGGPLPTNQEVYITVTYNYAANVQSLYSNAVLVAAAPAPTLITGIDDVNNWLGRSQWNDAMFKGSFDEFRIWDGAMLPDQILNDYLAGPDSFTPAVKPKLAVSKSGSSVVIAWPATATGFTLQNSAQVGTGAGWGPVGTAPVVVNGTNTVTVQPDQSTQFYRLVK